MTMTKEEAQKAYNDLIVYRQQNVLVKSKEDPGKIEVHHIVPISIGGLDEKSNKILLLAKEHFMAHVYLWIIHHDDKFHYQMTNALMNMHNGTKNGSRKELRDFILMSEDYQQAREEFGKIASKILSEANIGQKNPMYGKMWICNFELEESMIWNINDPIPNGWIKGRHSKATFKQIKNKIKKLEQQLKMKSQKTIDSLQQLNQLKNEFQYTKYLIKLRKILKHQSEKQQQHMLKEKKLKLLYAMFEEFKKNEFDGVVKKFGYTHTRNNLIMAFKAHIPEYVPQQCNRWKNRK